MSSGNEWVIEPRSEKLTARLKECWRYRALFVFFASRALKKTYARTVLGWGWLLIRPLAPVLVATFLFGSLLNVPSGNTPYFLFYLVGLMPWHLFENSWMWATRSLELNRKILGKTYVPRLIIPIASIAPAIVDALIYTALILVATLYFYVTNGKIYLQPTVALLIAPALLMLVILFSLSLGLWTSVWGAQKRDVRFTLRYILQIWFFLTPVIYPVSLIPAEWRWLASVNPLTPVIETFKWSVLSAGQVMWGSLFAVCGVLGGLWIVGLWYFNKAETLALD